MDDQRLGRLIRALRHRRRWRQLDVAERSGVGASTISRLEAGRIAHLSVATLRAVAATFGLSYEGILRGLGADEDRLLDERHADLMSRCARWLDGLGWESVVERSYSEWGERGSIDLLAWHAKSKSLLVIEIKSELVSIEGTLRKLDEKARLAAKIARPLGWEAVTVSRLLVLPDDRTQRRRVQAHGAVLDRSLSMRSRAVRAWSRSPSGPIAGLIFLTDLHRGAGTASRGRRDRVRTGSRPHVDHAARSSPAKKPAVRAADRP